MHFQNVTKMSLHYLYIDNLQNTLKNVSTVLVTLCFLKVLQIVSLFLRHVSNCHKNMRQIQKMSIAKCLYIRGFCFFCFYMSPSCPTTVSQVPCSKLTVVPCGYAMEGLAYPHSFASKFYL
jgi:hypothetical protein